MCKMPIMDLSLNDIGLSISEVKYLFFIFLNMNDDIQKLNIEGKHKLIVGYLNLNTFFLLFSSIYSYSVLVNRSLYKPPNK